MLVFGCKHAEDYGSVSDSVELCNARRYALANVVEVGRIAANNATDDDYGADIFNVNHASGGIGQFDRSRHVFDDDVLVAFALEHIECALKQRFGYVRIPLSHSDGKERFV